MIKNKCVSLQRYIKRKDAETQSFIPKQKNTKETEFSLVPCSKINASSLRLKYYSKKNDFPT